MNTQKYGLCPIVSEKDCTGCSACMNICPKEAITMGENKVGHILPFIEKDKCIDCNLCRKICPSNHSQAFLKQMHKVFAAWAVDKDEHSSSSSGGVSAVLSRYFIENNGVVYGCASLPGGDVRHIRIDSLNDLNKIKGSKYVQSEIGFIYRSVREDLNNGLRVLFTGTPCQIAGLCSFLGKDYPNLYTADLVCHGVPSMRLLKDHIKHIGHELAEVDRISFREGGYYLKLWRDDRPIYSKDDMHDLYYSGFNDCLYMRESCTNCRYARKERCADITMADYHKLGIELPFEIETEGNVSLLSINTYKGNELMKYVEDRLRLFERPIEEAIKGNPRLQKPCVRKSNYSKFTKLYQRYGYAKAAKRVMMVRFLKNKILTLYNCLKKI